MKVREFRESLGLTQAEAAAKIGISAPALCCAERGTRHADPETVVKIMRFSIDRKTKKPRVDANDILQTWCEAQGIAFPGAATSATVGC